MGATHKITDSHTTPYHASDRGMVLVLTLWILVILSLFLFSVSQTVHLHTTQAMAFKRECGGEGIGHGAIFAVTRELVKQRAELKKVQSNKDDDRAGVLEKKNMRGEELGFYLVNPEDWKVSKYDNENKFSSDKKWDGKSFAICYVIAEDAKGPLNVFGEKNWLRFPMVTREMFLAIKELTGKAGGRLLCVEQLLAARELQGKFYDGEKGRGRLDELLTTFSSGKIYINRAEALPLSVTLDMDIEKATVIADALKKNYYFYTLESLEKISGISAGVLADKISLTCMTYRIKVYSFIGGYPQKMEAVVVLTPENSFQIVYMGNA